MLAVRRLLDWIFATTSFTSYSSRRQYISFLLTSRYRRAGRRRGAVRRAHVDDHLLALLVVEVVLELGRRRPADRVLEEHARDVRVADEDDLAGLLEGAPELSRVAAHVLGEQVLGDVLARRRVAEDDPGRVVARGELLEPREPLGAERLLRARRGRRAPAAAGERRPRGGPGRGSPSRRSRTARGRGRRTRRGRARSRQGRRSKMICSTPRRVASSTTARSASRLRDAGE